MQGFDWQSFKEGGFLVNTGERQEPFFLEARKNQIFCFIGEREKKRKLYKCVHRYADAFSEGRYELYSVDEKIIQHNECFGKLQIVKI